MLMRKLLAGGIFMLLCSSFGCIGGESKPDADKSAGENVGEADQNLC